MLERAFDLVIAEVAPAILIRLDPVRCDAARFHRLESAIRLLLEGFSQDLVQGVYSWWHGVGGEDQ